MFRVYKDGFFIYDPFSGKNNLRRKHNCADCYFCQMCAESRCNLCRHKGKGKRCEEKKLNMKEQVELYELINR
ncbi:MAG: hypothetical protein N2260_00335 [Syntrophobacterales bacterium]|nr:hypothetical protein [Syntrophobacterales bacterium]